MSAEALYNASIKEVQAAYDAYQIEPEKNREFYQDFMVNKLFYFIQGRASHFIAHLPGNIIEKDELIQEGVVAVLMNLDRYDPYHGESIRPTTFFQPFIDDYMKRITNQGKLQPTYYMYGELNLEKLVKAHGYTGLDDPRLDEATLIDLSGISPKKLKTIFETRDRQVVSMGEDDGWLSSASQMTSNPESAVIANELQEAFAKARQTLSELQQRILFLFYVDEKEKKDNDESTENSARYVVNQLRKDVDFLKTVGLSPKNVTSVMVLRERNCALMKLKAHRAIRSQSEEAIDPNQGGVEITDEASVIEQALDDGLIDI